MLDVDALLQPVSEASPTGDALDYDIEFLQLEIAARGRGEQQMGEAVSAGEEPDWLQVETLALELSGRSKDIRVAILLARALLRSAGLQGLEQALRLLAGYVGRYWGALHPAPEPGEDDTIRLSALAALSDPDGLLGDLRRAPLVQSPAFGSVSLRDIQIATRKLVPGSDSPEVAQVDIEAAFLSAPPVDLAAAAAALASCVSSVEGIVAAVSEHDNTDLGSQLTGFLDTLRDARTELDSRIVSPADDQSPAEGQVAAPAATPVVRTSFGEIRGRSDIVAQLELICRWYATNEPASPVPALLDRAKRLVSQDFLALLLELAPAGVEQFRILAGIRDDAA
jgi:type VI secretion system protein ImpA